MAQDFRASAWEHLDKGDLPQASNKAWGLVAETVKAISAHYGGIIHTHRAIAEVVDELARLAGNAGDTETRRWINAVFLTARGLHTNFYENEMPRGQGPRRASSRARSFPGGFTNCFGRPAIAPRRQPGTQQRPPQKTPHPAAQGDGI